VITPPKGPDQLLAGETGSSLALSGEEASELPRPGRLSDYLCLGVVARIYRRALVDEVIAETQSKEKPNRLLPARWWSIT
jgi:hypothetical protein